MPLRRHTAEDEAGLGVAAVARRLGIAPGTLRTWDRRYGLGPTGHAAGATRRYTSTDLARLHRVRELMLEGVTPAEAARVVLATAAGDLRPAGAADGRARGRPRRGGRGGGRVIPLRDAPPEARGLARAAMALDSPACLDALERSLRRDGVVATWDEVVLPVLSGVGERWRSTGSGVEVEHLLSGCVEDALRFSARGLRKPRNVRPVLLAALEREQHHLPLHALAAGLAERGVAVRMLGPRLPAAALADAMHRTGPAAVFLWLQAPAGRSQAVAVLEQLPTQRPAAAVVVGGPGWGRSAPVPGTELVPDLRAAVRAVAAAVGVPVTDPR